MAERLDSGKYSLVALNEMVYYIVIVFVYKILHFLHDYLMLIMILKIAHQMETRRKCRIL